MINNSSQNELKKNLYHYYIKFTIHDNLHENDYVNVKAYDYDYLLHSEAYAKEEYHRMLREEPAASDVSLYLVRQSHHQEQEFFLESGDFTDSENKELERKVLERERLEIIAEYGNGALRHLIPIFERFYFRIRIVEGEGVPEEKDYYILGRNAGRCENFWDAYHTSFHIQEIELFKRKELNREHKTSRFFNVKLFLVERKSGGEDERLLMDNEKKYPLEPPLLKELKEKSYYEWNAESIGKENLTFGTKPVFWDEEPYEDLQHQEKTSHDAKELTQEFYQNLLDDVRFWDSLEFYYLVFDGVDSMKSNKKRVFVHHNLQVCRQAAIDFFDTVVQSKLSEPGADIIEPDVSLILVRKKFNSDPLYIRTTKPSSEELILLGLTGEKEILTSLGYPDEGINLIINSNFSLLRRE